MKKWNNKMKKLTIIILLLLSILNYAQNTYEIQPGVKNNQIVLQLSNISSTETANLPKPLPKRGLKNLVFREIDDETIILIPKEEKEVTYTFDVNYNIGNVKADTIEFLITDNKSVYLTKQFILQYSLPTEYKLEQNFPNPFNPTTKIRFSIPDKGAGLALTELKVYDILGNEVSTLVNEPKEPGYYEVEFNASELASGVYIYRLQASSFVFTKKMLMLK